MSGVEFNRDHGHRVALKLTFDTHIHNDFEYNMGLNVDHNIFDAREAYCSGMFFAFEEDVPSWLFHIKSRRMHKWAWTVAIPDDAKVVVFDDRVKCDRFILSDPRPISTLTWAEEPDHQLFSVYRHPSVAAFLPNIGEKVIRFVVQRIIDTFGIPVSEASDVQLNRYKYLACALLTYMPVSIQMEVARQKPGVIMERMYYDRFPKSVQDLASRR